MKKITSNPPKLILICLIIVLSYVIVYELILTAHPSSTETIYKLGVILSKVSYSIIAASTFYFISQYFPIYLPRERKKLKVLSNVFQKAITIDTILQELKNNLGVSGDDFKNSNVFRTAIGNINTTSPVGAFPNWYTYLYNIKIELLEIINSISIYNEFLSIDMLHEITLIERQLLTQITFAGYQVLLTTNLSYAEITIQEILIHNKHLQELREREFAKYQAAFKSAGDEYRKTYYGNQK